MKKKSIVLFLAVIFVLALSLFGFTACGGEESTYTVTFYLYRGAENTEVEVEAGSTVEKPEEDPVRDGYVFNGWYADERGKNPFDFSKPINSNTTVFAAWKDANVTLTFDYNYKGAESVSEEIPTDSKATEPDEDPVRERFEFTGWYTDSSCSELFDFETVLSKDTTVYAGWKQLVALVTFDLGYEEEGVTAPEVQRIDLTAGGKAVEPEDPVRGDEGDYRFEGWYVGSGRNEKLYDFGAEVTEDVDLHAKWTKLRATVTFDGNYAGAQPQEEKVALGGKLQNTPSPERTGYTFAGWYFDDECTIPYDFSENAIDDDLTVYAKWTPIELTITYNYNYEGAPAAQTVITHYDAVVTEPEEPVREGDTFIGWFTDAAQQNSYVFGGTITENLVLYAGWESKEGDSADTPNENGNWEITYYMNDGSGEIWEYLGKAAEEVSNGKYSQMKNGAVYPEREGYLAVGWYTDEACTEEFDFNTRIRKNYSLYAKWLKENVFEAEYTQFTNIGPDGEDKPGQGESNNPKGTNLIEWDQYNAGASGDYYVSYLFYEGAYLEFHINAEEAVTDAVLVLRATVDLYDMFFATGDSTGEKDGFGIYVNGTRYSFNYDLTGAIAPPPDGDGYNQKRPFEDYTISMTVSLQKGENVIRLVTENDRFFYGTMAAAAPMIDCIKIYTDVSIDWTPGQCFKEENENAIKDRWNGDRLE